MFLIKFIRKSSVRFFGDDLLSLSLLVEVCDTEEEVVDLLWPFLSSWRRGFRTALVKIILHQPVKESRLRLSRVECFARRKKEKEGKRKKKEREKMKTFAMVKRTGGNRRIDEAPSMYIYWKSRANLFL